MSGFAVLRLGVGVVRQVLRDSCIFATVGSKLSVDVNLKSATKAVMIRLLWMWEVCASRDILRVLSPVTEVGNLGCEKFGLLRLCK